MTAGEDHMPTGVLLMAVVLTVRWAVSRLGEATSSNSNRGKFISEMS